MVTSSVSPSAPAPAKVKKPKRHKLNTFLFVLLFISCAAAVAGYFFSDYFKPAQAAGVVSRPVADPIFISLAPMTVNLQANDRHRFLHVGVTLRVNDTKTQTVVTQYLPELTSRMQLVLSNRQSDFLITATDKAKLAAEALEALNRPLGPNQPALTIASVMFTVFMLQ